MKASERKLEAILFSLHAAQEAMRDLDCEMPGDEMWLCYAENLVTVAMHLLDTEVRRAVKARRLKR